MVMSVSGWGVFLSILGLLMTIARAATYYHDE